MKTLIFLFAISFIGLNGVFAQDRTMGGPIGGADMKLGRKPPGSNNIIAAGVTGPDGTFEFTDLKLGNGYFIIVDFGIKEKGIKSATQPVVIENIEIKKTPTSYKMTYKGVYKLAGKEAGKSKEEDVTIIITAKNGTIKASISTSRSNIKQGVTEVD